jgi:hypothetical protein
VKAAFPHFLQGFEIMTDQETQARHPFEPRPSDVAAARREPSDLERFLGGSPGVVAVRLLFLSLLVGFFLVWLDIRPVDILLGLQHMVERLWAAGFDAVREVAEYVLAGAVIVVPLWLALRLLNARPR